MKTARILMVGLLFPMFLLSLSSCQKDNDVTPDITGRWKATQCIIADTDYFDFYTTIELTFNSNDSFTFRAEGVNIFGIAFSESGTGTYEQTGDRISFQFNPGSFTFCDDSLYDLSYTVSSNSLNISGICRNGGISMTYVRF